MQRASTKKLQLTDSQKIAAEAAKTKVKLQFPKFFKHNGTHVLQSAKKKPGGLTNHTYLARTLSNQYIARVPGNGSEKMINREHESYNTRIAFAAGITPEVVYDEKNGKKVTRFLKDAMELSISAMRRPENILQVVDVLQKLHAAEPFANTVNIFDRNRQWLEILHENKYDLPEKYLQVRQTIDKIEAKLAEFKVPSVPCHIDPTPGNFIFSGGKLYLIDFEYAGNFDPVWDLAYLSMEADFTASQCNFLLRAHFKDALTDEIRRRFELYQPVAAYHVGLWSMMQLANKNYVGDPDVLKSAANKCICRCLELLDTQAFSEFHADKNKTAAAEIHDVKTEKAAKAAPTIFKRFKTVFSLAKDAEGHSKKMI